MTRLWLAGTNRGSRNSASAAWLSRTSCARSALSSADLSVPPRRTAFGIEARTLLASSNGCLRCLKDWLQEPPHRQAGLERDERGRDPDVSRTRRRSSLSIEGVSFRQPHAFACATCHRKRCSGVGRGAIGCCLCQVALIMGEVPRTITRSAVARKRRPPQGAGSAARHFVPTQRAS